MSMCAVWEEIIVSIYTEGGYEDRYDYLLSLAEEYDISMATVTYCADVLGPEEDFDGLVSALRDNEGIL